MAGPYTHRVTSPGRVNLIGGHTDYAGGHVLPLATDLHTRLRARPTDGRTVTIRSHAVGETRTFPVDEHEQAGDWTDYVRGCFAVLREAGYAPDGFEGELTGTLPIGSGLSSSASLELAVLAFLNAVNDLGLPRADLAILGQRVENDFVGVPCGIMDQFAIALGRDNHVLRLDTETLTYEHLPFPAEVRVVVLHTGIDRELSNSAYDKRRDTVEAALETLGVTSVNTVDAGTLADLPADQRHRLGYVLRENDRVLRASDALAAGDVETLGDLLVEAHHDIADHYDASCDELDFLVEAALEAGAYGARLTGAGWGGAAVALVDAAMAERLARAVYERYVDRFPQDDAHYHLVTPSDGVTVATVD